MSQRTTLNKNTFLYNRRIRITNSVRKIISDHNNYGRYIYDPAKVLFYTINELVVFYDPILGMQYYWKQTNY